MPGICVKPEFDAASWPDNSIREIEVAKCATAPADVDNPTRSTPDNTGPTSLNQSLELGTRSGYLQPIDNDDMKPSLFYAIIRRPPVWMVAQDLGRFLGSEPIERRCGHCAEYILGNTC